jgi:hypothetical protein
VFNKYLFCEHIVAGSRPRRLAKPLVGPHHRINRRIIPPSVTQKGAVAAVKEASARHGSKNVDDR